MKNDPIPHDHLVEAGRHAADLIYDINRSVQPFGDTPEARSTTAAFAAVAILIAAARILEVDETDLFEQLADYVNSNRN